ncbi:MAG TPA: hypothetical protein VFO65_00015 [Acidimicrobiales bacterium]|nr:hypothetical protein [Acidimicrobiales bacterium]
MLNVHHAACDGLGAVRLLDSVARAYAGVEDPEPAVPLAEARDLPARLAEADRPVRAPPRRRRRTDHRGLVPPPARMPMGLSVGAVTASGRLHLAFRYRDRQFDAAEAAAFATRYLAELQGLAAGRIEARR